MAGEDRLQRLHDLLALDQAGQVPTSSPLVPLSHRRLRITAMVRLALVVVAPVAALATGARFGAGLLAGLMILALVEFLALRSPRIQRRIGYEEIALTVLLQALLSLAAGVLLGIEDVLPATWTGGPWLLLSATIFLALLTAVLTLAGRAQPGPLGLQLQAGARIARVLCLTTMALMMV